MKRKLTETLLKWKTSKNRKPLLLKGARQVGKSYLIEHELGSHYDNVITVDLRNPSEEVDALFAGSLTPTRIIAGLELIYNTKIIPERTLIFFDEIQDRPKVLTALKYFCKEVPEYHVAAAGSLLGVYLKTNEEAPFPVGYVDTYYLEPMDFEEFLWAAGQEKYGKTVRKDPTDTLLDNALKDIWREYLVVGGMPEAVLSWTASHDINAVARIQDGILNDYRGDFSKYTDATTAMRIQQVFDSIPSQFAKANEKFLYGTVREGARAREYELAIEWLVGAGVVRRVRRIKRGDKTSLKAYVENNAFKLYFLDVGLLRSLAGIAPSTIMTSAGVFSEFGGLLAEQFVLQQLAPRELFYWADGESEVDFVTQISIDENLTEPAFSGLKKARSYVVPIEVKSGENVRAHSLKVYREKYSPVVAVRFSLRGLANDEGLVNIPLYKSFCFGEIVEG